MIWQSAKSCMTGLLALTLGLGGHSHAFRGGSPLAEADPPALLNTCLVTNDVARLTEFYKRVLQIPPKKIRRVSNRGRRIGNFLWKRPGKVHPSFRGAGKQQERDPRVPGT